ncbi:MAG: NUDIX domain-containing protein, partial [Desulfobacterales bacterium]|nr:NUDIX domain-containing protein [Desulfobacterales bacterium]
REEKDDWGLHWEFPGGTLEQDEGPPECIKRELREELGIGVEVEEIRQAVFKPYEGFNILLLAYQCTITEGTPSAIRCREVRWVGKDELNRLQMPPADEEIRASILSRGAYGV